VVTAVLQEVVYRHMAKKAADPLNGMRQRLLAYNTDLAQCDIHALRPQRKSLKAVRWYWTKMLKRVWYNG